MNDIPLLPVKLKGYNLKLYNSIHEQREYNKREIPRKGEWVEIGKFKRVIESFDIKKRYECIDRKENKDSNEITVVLKEMDLEKYNQAADALIDEIMEKQGEVLLKTISILMIKGLNEAGKESYVQRQLIKLKNAKNKVAMTSELAKINNESEKKRIHNKIESLNLKLKEMEDEENGK